MYIYEVELKWINTYTGKAFDDDLKYNTENTFANFGINNNHDS